MLDHQGEVLGISAWLDRFTLTTSTIPWWWGPALTAGLTILGGWIAIQFDRRKSLNQELIKKRLELYGKCVPLVNDIYSYFKRVGAFRQFSPDDIVKRKRELDGLIHINGQLFSSRRMERSYFHFINHCFSVRHGAGIIAKLRIDPERLKHHFKNEWRDDWDASFDTEQIADLKKIEAAYIIFVQLFAWQIGARSLAPFRAIPLFWEEHSNPTLAIRHKIAGPGSSGALDAAKLDAISKAMDAHFQITNKNLNDATILNTVFASVEDVAAVIVATRQSLERSTRYRFDSAKIDIAAALPESVGALKKRIASIAK